MQRLVQVRMQYSEKELEYISYLTLSHLGLKIQTINNEVDK